MISYYKCLKCGQLWRYKPETGVCDCGEYIDLDNCTIVKTLPEKKEDD